MGDMANWWERVLRRDTKRDTNGHEDEATQRELRALRLKHATSMSRTERLLLQLAKDYKEADEALKRD